MAIVITFDRLVVELLKFKKEYGHCLVPHTYVTDNGINLGVVVDSIRRGHRKVSAEERAMLDKIEFIWDVKAWKATQKILAILMGEEC